jgi:dihydrofolate synthase/folylpolyglutamate synthase
MSTLSYRSAIDFLFGLETSAIKLGLGRTVDLLRAVGNPEAAFPSVHIAGTNGKGSVACFLNSILVHSGKKTGLFTSPHLVDYRERIRVDGSSIPPAAVSSLASEIAPHVRRIGASYFEATTALAFEHFRRERVEAAVVEVGMGGRLDSTNVIRPILSCITTIDFDHEQYLGKTLAKIAGEKAGIIKERVPLVCGHMPQSARRSILRVAAACGSEVFETGTHTVVKPLELGLGGSIFEYRGLAGPRRLEIGLAGSHQITNAAIAVLAAEVLGRAGYGITDRAISEGLRRARWPGRLQVLKKKPLIVCDGAHNVSGARALARAIKETGLHGVTAVFGVLRDKDCERMLTALAPCVETFVFTKPDYHRALPLRKLLATARNLGLGSRGFSRVDAALGHALRRMEPSGALLVCGSLYTIGEAMQYFGFSPQRHRVC